MDTQAETAVAQGDETTTLVLEASQSEPDAGEEQDAPGDANDEPAWPSEAFDGGKPRRKPRRGPPPKGEPDPRVTVLLTTSRLSSRDGVPLRRGRAVSVPERRLDALVAKGKVVRASEARLAAALKLGPIVELA